NGHYLRKTAKQLVGFLLARYSSELGELRLSRPGDAGVIVTEYGDEVLDQAIEWRDGVRRERTCCPNFLGWENVKHQGQVSAVECGRALEFRRRVNSNRKLGKQVAL